MNHVSCVVSSGVTNFFLLIHIVAPELDDHSLSDPLLQGNGVAKAELVHYPTRFGVADANVEMIKSIIHLQCMP